MRKEETPRGLIVARRKRERVTELLNDYARRFADDFVACCHQWSGQSEAVQNRER